MSISLYQKRPPHEGFIPVYYTLMVSLLICTNTNAISRQKNSVIETVYQSRFGGGIQEYRKIAKRLLVEFAATEYDFADSTITIS